MTRVRPTTPSAPQPADPGSAIPSYGSAPPPSVVATLKSISEFTIVEPAEESPDAPAARETGAYEPPTVTGRAGTAPDDDAAVLAEFPETGSEAGDERPSGAEASPFDTLSEADRLFDAPEAAAESAEPIERVESEANDDVIATAFGADDPMLGRSREVEEVASGEPTYIGGDPSTLFAAESLEEVARGIRAGEIVLPPIDRAAEQSAVLAAVLAALLAPRR